jgi:hypothetical protein
MLFSLDLSWLKTKPATFLPILESVCEKIPSLVDLDLSWTKLASQSNDAHNDRVLELLSGFIKRNTKLNHLELTQCDLSSSILEGMI